MSYPVTWFDLVRGGAGCVISWLCLGGVLAPSPLVSVGVYSIGCVVLWLSRGGVLCCVRGVYLVLVA